LSAAVEVVEVRLTLVMARVAVEVESLLDCYLLQREPLIQLLLAVAVLVVPAVQIPLPVAELTLR